MLSTYLIASTFAALGLAFWVVRGNPKGRESRASLRQIDIAAFRNLLSNEDDEFLRSSLSGSNYRQVRRARVRATQEYLVWIADNCAILVAQLRFGGSEDETQTAESARTLAINAVQLRLVALGIWILLWLEYFVPALKIRPMQLVDRYDGFRRRAESYFPAPLHPPVMPTKLP